MYLKTKTTVEVLAEKLRSHFPVKISSLSSLLENYEYFKDFLNLIDEYLPEFKEKILESDEPSKQISLFSSEFSAKYFPLWEICIDDGFESYREITSEIPVQFMGIDYDDIVENKDNYNTGVLLMTIFFENPYNQDGQRLGLCDKALDFVDPKYIKMLPDNGYSQEEIHKYLDGTPYAPLATWGDMLNYCTNNYFLDNTDTMVQEGMGLPEWNRRTVDEYAQDWKAYEGIAGPAYDMAKIFDKNPEGYFQEVISFIYGQMGMKVEGLLPRAMQIQAGQLELPGFEWEIYDGNK